MAEGVATAKFLENEVVKYNRRIQQIKENPDPYRLKTNLALYELERDYRIHQLEWLKAGKPFATGNPRALLRAMGFELYDAHSVADRLATGNWRKYYDAALSDGWPEMGCDRTVLCITVLSSGDAPKPNFVSAMNQGCQYAMLNGAAMARYFKVPIFPLDMGFDETEENLVHMAGQLEEMVEFAESKVPGVKLDMDRLMELHEYEKEAAKLYHDVYELRKRKPCPINPRDAQYEARHPASLPFPERAVQYLRDYRDELYERAEKGIGGMVEERLRINWTTVGLNYDPEIYRWIRDQGVSVPFYQFGMAAKTYGALPWQGGYGDEKQFGRRLTPFEEESRAMMCNSWNGRGDRWVRDVLYVTKDQDCDGIVHVLQSGCTQVLGLGKLLADAAEEQLGVPVLNMDARGIIPEGYNSDEWKQKLSDFFALCEAHKAMRAARV